MTDNMFTCINCGKMMKEPGLYCSDDCKVEYNSEGYHISSNELNDDDRDDEFQSKHSGL